MTYLDMVRDLLRVRQAEVAVIDTELAVEPLDPAGGAEIVKISSHAEMFGKPGRGSERILNVLALHEHVGKEAVRRDNLWCSGLVGQNRNKTRTAAAQACGSRETHVDHGRLVGVLAGEACRAVTEVILLDDAVCCIGRYRRQCKCMGCGRHAHH